MRTCVPSVSGMSEIAACPPSPIADDPSALPPPPPLPPPSVTRLACSLDASPCMPAVVLYFSRSCTVKLKYIFFTFYLFFCLLFLGKVFETYYKYSTI